MIKDLIFGVVGGLGLFLFGMKIMSDGLKAIAGEQLKKLLEILTKHRVIAVLVGAFTTAIIQSSSATTVMVVGFVNAGLIGLKQALCVVLGANIGTTFTAWLVSAFNIGGLKITAYALPAIGVGFLIQIVSKTPKKRNLGSIILGFGILFIGLSFMKDAFDPLESSKAVQNALIWLGQNPILAVLTGTLITVLLQSSSASIAMVQLLAMSGAFGTDWDVALKVAIPFILGDNIGTTITAQLAAIQASRNSKRVAIGHTMFNCIGVIYMLPLVWTGIYPAMIKWITPFELTHNTIMVYIAISHSVFNIFNTILFMPIISTLEKIVLRILPVTAEELTQKPVVLEKHLLNTPTIAIEQTKREIIRMAQKARKALNLAIDAIISNDRKAIASVRKIEDSIDDYQFEITSYLSEMSRRQLSDEVSNKLPVLLHTVNDLERIGDHAVNIVEITERKINSKISFSDSAFSEIDRLKKEVNRMFECVTTSLENDDTESAKSALKSEEQLNNMQMEFRRSHVQRMTKGLCSPQSGLIFIDLVDNVEKIGDHLTNIAQAVIGGLQWEGVDIKTSS